uniref:Ig-like domain-containing protein n=1 Tax=Scophthalmus maximus TaxID=52904 RepID=A0A8D3A2S8_SCOMX
RWVRCRISLLLFIFYSFLLLTSHISSLISAIKGRDPHLTVIVGDEVTLPCENRTEDQLKCNGTSWLFNERPRSPAVEQIKLGQVVEQARTKSDRLSVTEDCSLVVKKVTVKDAGLYACRQFNKSGQQQGSSALVYLSDWLNTGVKDEWQSSQVSCSSTVTFKPSLPHPKYEESLRCRVTDRDGGNLLLCSVSTQSPCEKRGSSVDLLTFTFLRLNHQTFVTVVAFVFLNSSVLTVRQNYAQLCCKMFCLKNKTSVTLASQ